MTDFTALQTAVTDHARGCGLFEAVNGHEPKSAPAQTGLTCAVWVQAIGPAQGASGLATTTGRVELTVRLYSSMLADPPDAIDPALLTAASTLLAAYSGDFTLGGQVKHVDLLGSNGIPLSARAGYLNQDNRLFRVVDITLPMIINDLWAQAE